MKSVSFGVSLLQTNTNTPIQTCPLLDKRVFRDNKSNSIRWSKFHPLYEVIGGGVKIFSSLKHNLLQQFPYFPSQLVGSHNATSSSPL
jgi:hypothetical protein